MIKGIYLAARSMNSRMKNIDIIANNLANVNTNGYKREVPFNEILNQAGQVQLKQLTDFQQGELTLTSAPLDLAISGKGFFAVKTPDGIEATRDGKFSISDEGFLVNNKGEKVLGRNGAVDFAGYKLDKNQTISVSKNGEIKIGDNYVDKLMIVIPEKNQDMVRMNKGNFLLGGLDYSKVSEGKFEIAQGYIEESNVSPITEMESMIQINSDYDAAHKMVTYLDQSLEKANEIGRI